MSSVFKLVEIVSASNPIWHDLELVDGMTSYLDEGSEMVAQRIRTKLLWIAGEWYQDQRQGVPWMTQILGQRPTLARLEHIFRVAIQQIPGVSEIRKLEVTSDTDGHHLDFEVLSDEGYVVRAEDLSFPFEVNL